MRFSMQLDRTAWRRVLILVYVGAVLILLFPLARILKDPAFRGAIPYFGSDELHYVVRLQEGLLGPRTDPSNGIFSGSDVPMGAQPAGIEKILGISLAWTGIPAWILMMLLSACGAALTLPLTALLSRRVGATEGSALLWSLLFFFLLFGPLRRFVHGSLSFPLTEGALLALFTWWQTPSRTHAVIAGLLLGTLPYIYFWSWTFAFAVLFILFLLVIIFMRGTERRDRCINCIILGTCACVIALPSFLRLAYISSNPLAHEVALRSSVVFARDFESIPRSILITLLATFAAWAFLRPRPDTKAFPLVACAIALFVAMHQQFFHGHILSFATHYYPYVCLVSLLVLAKLASEHWPRRIPAIGIALISVMFLIAALFDYRGRASVFLPLNPAIFSTQHLGPVLATLQKPPRNTVLTDRLTALVVAASTDDDVVFTEHLRHVLIPTREYAERWCLSEVLGHGHRDLTWIAYILNELSSAGRREATRFYDQNRRTTAEACTWVESHLPEALARYHVTLLLWNERSRPDWQIPSSLFRLRLRGEGWSLWEVRA